MNKSGFFEFLKNVPKYANGASVARLNLRREFIIVPFIREIAGSRVLDIASHDGRWAYAFAEAGAREVVGIEGRGELVAQFASFPETAFKRNVRLHTGDLYAFLRNAVQAGERFDVVGVLGIFYHIMDHYELLKLIRELGPKLVIIDGEFMTATWPHIALSFEDTAKELNSTAHFCGQKKAPVGIPSQSALDRMADSLGYSSEWSNWDKLAPGKRAGVREDYFREGPKRRFTCVLRPLATTQHH